METLAVIMVVVNVLGLLMLYKLSKDAEQLQEEIETSMLEIFLRKRQDKSE